MRIVIDMQGAQTASRTRGIGRYSLAFAKALVRNRGPHDVFLALNGLFPDTIMPIRAAFASLLPRDRIRVWEAPGPLAAMDGNAERRARAALIREAFLASLDPDIVHVTSLFEGFVDDAVVTIGTLGRTFATSVTLYDLIPLHDPDRFLKPNPAGEAHYRQSLAELDRADLLLAISDFTARDAALRLALPDTPIVNVSSATDVLFAPRRRDPAARDELCRRFGIARRFIVTSGTIEPHKNLERLFDAFAQLPARLRTSHCIVLIGNFVGWQGDVLLQMAARAGLRKGDLVITGYVSDEDLIGLYNACDLMVFPSLDEGFGLPALEAMACGAPTIGSRAASIPEIIGRDDALFDPTDVGDMARLIARGLEDAGFRDSLRSGATERVGSFSWNRTAQEALRAMETLRDRPAAHALPLAGSSGDALPRLAFVSPLPPDRSGIADYAADLVPALAERYDITLISRGHSEFRDGRGTIFKVRSPDWLRENRDRFDRVVYQFGNSPFHDYMIALSRELPGPVVLHDFFLGALLAWLELTEIQRGAWTDALYESHGYAAVRTRFRDIDAARTLYPANLAILRDVATVVVHSEHARALGARWLGAEAVRRWRVVPQLKAMPKLASRAAARRKLRIPDDAFLVCSFGAMDGTKLNHRLVEAFARSRLSASPTSRLVFVGEEQGGTYGEAVRRQIEAEHCSAAIRITGWTDPAAFEAYLAASDLAVQLRTNSRGETSRAILECMAAGLATIINAHGSAAEIPAEAAVVLEDDFADRDLTAALDRLFEDAPARQMLGQAAHRRIAEAHGPAACATGYAEAIESVRGRRQASLPALAEQLAAQQGTLDARETKALAAAIAQSVPFARPDRQLLLDVTETVRSGRRTGIERVARALVLALIDAPPAGYRAEPVYLSDIGGRWHYRTARQFTLGLMGCPADALRDDIAEPGAGDVLLTLDLTGQAFIDAHANGLYRDLRNAGVRLYSVIYDLLPVQLPDHFPKGATAGHEAWLTSAGRMDGVVAISRAVADDLRTWLRARMAGELSDSHDVGWFHLGADIDNSDPSRGMPPDAAAKLVAFAARPTFLMVGTIEPRKGHLQAIAAFERLWQAGIDVNLVIVGAEGWQGLPADMRRTIPEIVARLAGHPERDRRLFWLNDVSDEYLERAYAASSCLIAPSEGEGFGLPLIEAARHGIPILARDLPVFREVAGDHAAYFSGLEPADLAAAIETWLALHRAGRQPRSAGMPWSTWRESARRIADLIAAWERFPPAAAADD